MSRRLRAGWPPAALSCAALLIAALLGPTAAAAPSKPFSADVFPSCVAAGTTTSFAITLRNETATQRLGSANVTPPAGFTLVSATSPGAVAGGVLQLRDLDLAPGGSVTVGFEATSPTTPDA